MVWTWARRAFPAAALAAALGCGEAPRLVEVIDLAAELPAADVQVEVSRIDVGTAAARPFLQSGWWRDEVDRSTGRSFAWSRGERSRLVFFLAWRRHLRLELRCRPFVWDGAPTQVVTVLLNGSELGRCELRPGVNGYGLDVPAEVQRPGRNILELRYGHHRAPAEVIAGSRDGRQLAVAWEEVGLVGPGLPPGGTRVVDMASGAIELPTAARADFYLRLPAGAVLNVDGVEGAGETHLELSVRGEGGRDAALALPSALDSGFRVPLSVPAGLARLRFQLAPVDGDGGGRARFLNPRILAPMTTAAAGGARAAPAPPVAAVGEPPNLVIYLIDALRADRLGCYGAARPLSPRIDGFARDAIVFEQAIAQSSWTKSAVASILTGLRPPAHGANGPDDRLPETVPLLSEALADAGYQTAAFVANAYVNRPFGFARGFASFRYYPAGEGTSEALNEGVEQWLDRRRAGPFFLFVHAIDPHAPYAAPAPFRSRFAAEVEDPQVGEVATVRGLVTGRVPPTEELREDLEALYDAEVAHNDASFGGFLDLLEERGMVNDSVILLVADHGEAFGEHGSWTHGLDLHREVLHVPMILRLPGARHGGRRVREPVQHIDVQPTLLALAGVAAPAGGGHTLLDPAGGSPVVVSFLDYWGRRGASAVSAEWTYIEPMSEDFGPEPMLFDRLSDPLEEHNIAAERPVVAGFMAARLRLGLGTRRAAERAEVDGATRRQLEALGYLD